MVQVVPTGGYQFYRWRNGGHLGYNRTRETFRVGSGCVAGRQPRERFFPGRRFRAEARPELDQVNSLPKPNDALGRNEYDLVLFEDETEARPGLV